MASTGARGSRSARPGTSVVVTRSRAADRRCGLASGTIRASCVLLGMLACVGCASGAQTQEPPPLLVADASGTSMADISDHVRDDATLMVQDVSVVVDATPSYNASQQTSTQWIVVAACSDSRTIDDAGTVEVAVIPADDYDDAVRAQVADGEMASTVVCDGLPDKSS